MLRVAPTLVKSRPLVLTIVVAALGYLVDIYDLILFSIVRLKSLSAIGVPPERVLDKGVYLLNMQMGGMLLGGILWGVLGDKKGRLSVLFGSILMYSLANLANGFVQDVETYAWLRLIAGIGLAGELGAGVTLVLELMHKETRAYGTTIVAAIGILGAILAVLVGEWFDWRTAYIVGGVMGLGLLLLRVGVYESSMFSRVKDATHVVRGQFFQLFWPWHRLSRYVAVILTGVPIWYIVGILVTFSPEIGAAMGLDPPPRASTSVMLCYLGLAAGDLVSGVSTQLLRSRKKVIGTFLVFCGLGVLAYFGLGSRSASLLHASCFVLGFSGGYWAVFVTVASEQFGTNIRATATTTAPNFVRGAVVLLTSAFQAMKPSWGIQMSAIVIGIFVLGIAGMSLFYLEETHGKDLDFLEE